MSTARVRLFVGALALAGSLLACELLLRVLAPRSTALYVPDPAIGVIHEPGATGRWVSTEYAVPITINRSGFRDRDYAVPKPRGVRRVVVLGDSYVEAFQVPLEATFHKLLERRLSRDGMAIEVPALGVGGFGAAQELLCLRAYGRPLEPDFVVLLFNPGNDVRDSSRQLKGDPRLPFFAGDGDRLVAEPFVPQPAWRARLSNRLRNLSQLYALARDASYRTGTEPGGGEAPAEFMVYHRTPGEAWGEAWRLTAGLLGEVARETGAMGARLLVVVVPNRIQLPGQWDQAVAKWPALADPAFSPQAPVARIGDILAAAAVPSLDLVTRFAERAVASGEEPHFAIDGHWNETGHRWAAEEIERALRDLGWLAVAQPTAAKPSRSAAARSRASLDTNECPAG